MHHLNPPQTLSLLWCAQATQGNYDGTHDALFCGVSTDSRAITQGMLYVALRGERFDGHDFATHALAAGASAVLVDHPIADIPNAQQIIVKDCYQALLDMAAARRSAWTIPIVGITGSAGKTSTKEMMARASASQKRSFATQGNYNNHIGMPLTLLNAPADTELLVLEMGMNHAGEIDVLSRTARPDIAIITTVDAAHLEFFDSVADIARAKAEIMNGLPKGATIMLPADNAYLPILMDHAQACGVHPVLFGLDANADYCLTHHHIDRTGTHATLRHAEVETSYHLGALGVHHAVNALAVLGACVALQLDLAQCAHALHHYHEPKGRGTLHSIAWNDGIITLIDETYNASPVAMRAAFARARAIANTGNHRLIAVLGDMLELGTQSPELHAGLAESLIEQGFDRVLCLGETMRHLHEALPNAMQGGHFMHHDEAAQALAALLLPNDLVLCKGSRGMRIETIIQQVQKNAA
ncbi:MAG: UDP-N-acetylmuramoyl-tripeptide--D-alanyl-D-alanine ligase [Alphaproteobacteria bacterium]|nr:MAG: UDP-N-acetylmuramoyl-tripeptide--D-alanyl-D-alanine ligase [Alphaproteobacteria bacterium]TAF15925.1 MAG: UDP-N-acetylmuramoyl-tripeptide--D-alanyl-D-alanine ligase [Alphaproteobacteria bacterium]TAF38981.1 MAG: UDP-N-acetylmuramoyl-tripeptide--D-alanyl-D-alanine ligase [Alphaproteobacteria bacterium]TAF76739.1 MAG: UDP-N-acetylmuramoyl-tripeptide--D-alanyl-D-alanine ligase [Alphaproteobacteria bacterium]